MNRTFAATVVATAALAAFMFPENAGAQGVPASDKMSSSEQAREENAYAIGLQAYLWGFPLHYYSRAQGRWAYIHRRST
jgi:hypothetical protein